VEINCGSYLGVQTAARLMACERLIYGQDDDKAACKQRVCEKKEFH